MKAEFKNKFDIMEKDREEIISLINKLDDQKLNFKPAPGKWSILQILFHIIKAEHLTIISLKNSIGNKKDLKKSSLGAAMRSSLLNISLRSSIKIKSPDILKKVPETYDIEQLKKKWTTLRSELNKILNGAEEEVLNKYVFKHPYAGRLNFTQSIEFLYEHVKHHKRQIKRINDLLSH